ncbi:MAG: cyclase family protein [Bacteroidia bacterium]|nr:cyclase family protein [Bacteroidia bacterium]
MRIHDLTQPFRAQTPGFESKEAKRIELNGWNASTLTLYSHAGTHMDAPVHFGVDDRGVDSYPVSRFVSKAWIANATSVAPGGEISKELVTAQVSGLKPGDSLLIRTDWYKRIYHPSYRNDLPRISEGLAHWCVDQGVNVLGVEPPSVADVNNLEEVTRIHQILLPTVIIVEGLCGLDEVSRHFVQLIALPILIEGGDGAPARVIVIESEES